MATLRLVPVSGPAIDDVKDQSMVGRDPSCEIVVTDGSVSRRHARLERRGGAWWVVDQGSANGTYVNSLKVAEQALKNNQELRFGALAFRVDLHEDPEATVATPFLADDSATVMAPQTPPPVPPSAPPPPLPSTPTPRPAAAAAPPARRRRRRRRPRRAPPPRRSASGRRGRPRPVPQMPGGRAAREEGQEPALLGRDRLLRLPAARGGSRRRHRRRRVHGHEGRGRRRPRVARAGAAGPDRRGRGRDDRGLPQPAHRRGGRGGHHRDRASRRTRPS